MASTCLHKNRKKSQEKIINLSQDTLSFDNNTNETKNLDDKEKMLTNATKNRKNRKKILEKKFICEDCNYKTTNSYDYNKHLGTSKHKNILKGFRCECGRSYQHRQSLHRHRMKCKTAIEYEEINNYEEDEDNEYIEYEEINNNDDNDNINYKNMFVDTINENKELKKILLEQQKQISEIIPKIGNNNNTTYNKFNLNVFLNEHCKDALNINDFLESIQIQMNDLESIKNNSLEYGINDIFTKALTNIDVYKRPIHCTDTKRKILYIKDNNIWDRDDEYKSLKNTINDVIKKQRHSIKQWEIKNPEWEKNEKLQTEYAKLVKNSTQELDEIQEGKIIKNIVDNVICNN